MLQYTPTKDDYAAFLRALLKKKNRGPWGMIMMLMGIVLIGMSIWFAFFTESSTGMKIFVFVFSLFLGVTRVFRYFGTEVQLKITLSEMESRNPIAEDFWKMHTLSISDDQITIAYGEKTNSYPLGALKGFEKRDGMLLINIADQFVEFLPAGQYTEEQLKALDEKIDEGLHGAARREVREHYERMQEEAVFCYEMPLTRLEMATRITDMKRNSYRFLPFWNTQELFRLGAPILLFIAFLVIGNPGFSLLSVLLFFSLNFPFVMIFTPNQIRNTFNSMTPNRNGYKILATRKMLYSYSDRQVQSCRFDHIRREYTAKDGSLYLYASRTQMFYIPADQVEAFRKSRPVILHR